MKNGDLPAMPIELNGFGLYAPVAHLGLTKREYFAGLALQGLASETGRYHSCQDMAFDAVKLADALLAELEEAK